MIVIVTVIEDVDHLISMEMISIVLTNTAVPMVNAQTIRVSFAIDTACVREI